MKSRPKLTERSGGSEKEGETAGTLPFQLMAIVQNREVLGSVLDVAATYPRVGFGLMLRHPEHRGEGVRALAREALARELPSNIRLIPNGCRVEGIPWGHLTAAQVRSGDAEAIVRSSDSFGCSVHSLEEIVAAQRLNPAYLLLSPVFQTNSKPDVLPLGIGAFRQYVAAASTPVIALGGITSVERAVECLGAGAWGVASITLFAPSNAVLLKEVIALFAV